MIAHHRRLSLDKYRRYYYYFCATMALNGKSAYRALLRASRIAFAGDKEAIKQAREQLRENFFANRALTGSALDKAIKEAMDAAEFLEQNIVQGQLNETGNYAVELRPDQAENKRNDEELTHLDASVVEKAGKKPEVNSSKD